MLVRALKTVLILWAIHVLISLVYGSALETFPGIMENKLFRYGVDLASNLSHWDPRLDQTVVEFGYGPNSVYSAKYPLVPMSARLLVQVLGWRTPLALQVVNKVSLLPALLALWYLVYFLYRSAETADRAITYMSFPLLGTGFVWWMSYPEPTYLLLWALAFGLFFQQKWYYAGLATTLAVWTRPQAIILIPIFAASIVLTTLRQPGGLKNLLAPEFWQKALKVCALPTLAVTAWIYHTSVITDIPLSPLTAQSAWQRSLWVEPWVRIYIRFRHLIEGYSAADSWGIRFETWQLVLVLASLTMLGVFTWKKMVRWELFLFSLATTVIPLYTGIYGVGRFALLSWTSLALLYVIPPKYDSYVWLIGLFLSVIALVVLGIAPFSTYWP